MVLTHCKQAGKASNHDDGSNKSSFRRQMPELAPANPPRTISYNGFDESIPIELDKWIPASLQALVLNINYLIPTSGSPKISI